MKLACYGEVQKLVFSVELLPVSHHLTSVKSNLFRFLKVSSLEVNILQIMTLLIQLYNCHLVNRVSQGIH